MILGVLRLIVFLLDTALFIPVLLLASPLDRNAKLAHRIARHWCRLNLALFAVRVRVDGQVRDLEEDIALADSEVGKHCAVVSGLGYQSSRRSASRRTASASSTPTGPSVSTRTGPSGSG